MFLLLHKTFAANTEYVNYADELLHLFVQHFAELHESNMLVYYVHNMVHLADDARKYGALDAVSAFAFKNFWGKLTGLVRKPGKPLQQIIRRMWEDRQYGSGGESKSIRNGRAKHHHGTVDLPSGVGQCRQYKQLYVNGVLLSVQAGNNCITLGTQILMLKNIVVKHSETMLIYQKFRVVEDFFKYPLKSSVISINCVSDLSSKLFIGTLSDYLSVKMLHCLITVDMQFFHFSIENTFCWLIVSNVFNVCTVVVAIITSPLAAVSRRRYSSGHGLSLDYLLAGNLRKNFHDIWGTHRL